MISDIVCALGIFSLLIGLGNIIIGICENSYEGSDPLNYKNTIDPRDPRNQISVLEYIDESAYLKTLTPEEQNAYYIRNFN